MNPLLGVISPARQRASERAEDVVRGGRGPPRRPASFYALYVGVGRARATPLASPQGDGILPGVRSWSPAQKTVVRKHQQAIVKQLREAGMTQAEAGAAVGVARSTVESWETPTGSNDRPVKASASPPDVRVKVAPAAKPVIAKRLDAGETQAQVAADYGVTDRTASASPRRRAPSTRPSRSPSRLARSPATG